MGSPEADQVRTGSAAGAGSLGGGGRLGSGFRRLARGLAQRRPAGLGADEVGEAGGGGMGRAQRMLAVARHRVPMLIGRGGGGRAHGLRLRRLLEAAPHELDQPAGRAPAAVGLVDDEHQRAAVAHVDQMLEIGHGRLDQQPLLLVEGQLAGGPVLRDQPRKLAVGDERLDLLLGRGLDLGDLGRGEPGGEAAGQPAAAGTGHRDGRAGGVGSRHFIRIQEKIHLIKTYPRGYARPRREERGCVVRCQRLRRRRT